MNTTVVFKSLKEENEDLNTMLHMAAEDVEKMEKEISIYKAIIRKLKKDNDRLLDENQTLKCHLFLQKLVKVGSEQEKDLLEIDQQGEKISV